MTPAPPGRAARSTKTEAGIRDTAVRSDYIKALSLTDGGVTLTPVFLRLSLPGIVITPSACFQRRQGPTFEEWLGSDDAAAMAV